MKQEYSILAILVISQKSPAAPQAQLMRLHVLKRDPSGRDCGITVVDSSDFIVVYWDFYEIFLGLLWNFYVILMGF